MKTPEFRAVVEDTANLFSSAIPHQTPQEMKLYLEQDAFVFSGLKTHAQLTEARSFLKDEKGNIIPYHEFEKKILKLNEKYNQNYLEAEYEFAVQSAQSAAAWANLQDDTDRYWLEYRTANDNRVRDSHAALNGICLPKTDPFWTEYYPPNAWRCRCVAVEVLAKDYNPSQSDDAIKKGQKATTQISASGKNKLQMFRFNPGANQKLFPPKNAYTKVTGAEKVKKVVEEATEKEKNKTTVFHSIIGKLKEYGVGYRETKPLQHKLSEEEIISRVGGGDLTKGSCASLCLAYAGNKAGLDVLDFRDGESRSFFSRYIKDVITVSGGFVEKDYNDYKAISKLLKNVQTEKEYILATGKHASIIRKSKERGWEYLELQSPTNNGYRPLTNLKFKSRFGCQKSYTSYKTKLTMSSFLIDIEDLNKDGFKELLGYINTQEGQEKKGSKGRIK